MIVAALALTLDASGASQVPPPPILVNPQQELNFLDGMPAIEIGGRRFRVFAIQGLGGQSILDAAAKTLSSEGWKCSVAVDQNGVLKLAVFAQGRSLDEVRQLAKRFEVHEFGAIEVKPMLFPDQSGQ